MKKGSLIILLICLVAGCVTAEAKQDTLALPTVPDSLTVPAERAAYVLEHFWDDLDFSDTKRSRNETFLEQAFSDFISIFPHAPEDARKAAVANLIQRSESDSIAYNKLRKISEIYLYYVDSPFKNEEYYTIFLRNYAGSPLLDTASAARVESQLATVLKNGPGSMAPDFVFTDRNGEQSSLYSFPARGDILLLFYDPDCDHCHDVIKILRNNDKLNEDIRNGQMTLLAIYSGPNQKLWQKTAGNLPENWTVGYEPGTLDEEEVYIFREFPSIYILDNTRKVIEKNIRID